jgi:hypothetical protein
MRKTMKRPELLSLRASLKIGMLTKPLLKDKSPMETAFSRRLIKSLILLWEMRMATAREEGPRLLTPMVVKNLN